MSQSALTSAIRRFVSSPLSACAGALSGGLEAGLDVLAFSGNLRPRARPKKVGRIFGPRPPRTGEGRKRVKERGIRFGRPRKMTPHQRQEALPEFTPSRSTEKSWPHFQPSAGTEGAGVAAARS